MDAPVFDETLRTGNESIDSQHEWLFALAARITRQVGRSTAGAEAEPDSAACSMRNDDAVAEAVYGLMDYVTEHFSDEEQLMVSAGFPSASVHKVLHEELSQRVSGYSLRFVNGDDLAASEFVDFFNEWLTKHIMCYDRQFVVWQAASANR